MSGAARAVGWFVVGWLACFTQGLVGSKLHGLAETVRGWCRSRLYAARLWWAAWLTWQGASREQREQMGRDGEDRFDLRDNDLRSE